ncbi:hypothetical protein [Microbacterium sp. P5_E9]
MRRAIAVVLMALMVAVAPFAAHAAAVGDVPDEVTTLFDCDSATDLVDLACGDGAFDVPHTAYVWTDAFRAGQTTDEAVKEPVDWVAARYDGDGALVGTARVSGYDGAPQFVGYDDDAALARTLAHLAPGQLVEDAPAGAWYLLADATITPLNDWARRILPATLPVADAQALIAADHAQRIADACGGRPFCLDAATFSLLTIVAALAGVGVVLWFAVWHARRPRRPLGANRGR